MGAVRLEPFDPSWSERFQRARASVASALGSRAVAIEHIGSTAVPGLAAKPTVDVLVGVGGDLDGVVDPLVASGYEYVPAWEAQLPERRYFRLRHELHLHVVVHGSAYWERQLRFRDVLREEPAVARAYEALKRRLAASCETREEYTAGKSDFVWAILRAPDAGARAAAVA